MDAAGFTWHDALQFGELAIAVIAAGIRLSKETSGIKLELKFIREWIERHEDDDKHSFDRIDGDIRELRGYRPDRNRGHRNE